MNIKKTDLPWALYDKERGVFLPPFFETKEEVEERFLEKIEETKKYLEEERGRPCYPGTLEKVLSQFEIIQIEVNQKK